MIWTFTLSQYLLCTELFDCQLSDGFLVLIIMQIVCVMGNMSQCEDVSYYVELYSLYINVYFMNISHSQQFQYEKSIFLSHREKCKFEKKKAITIYFKCSAANQLMDWNSWH